MKAFYLKYILAPFLRLCFHLVRPFFYIFNGGPGYIILSLLSSFLFLKSLVLLGGIKSPDLSNLAALPAALYPLAVTLGILLVALLQMLVTNLTSNRLMFIQRSFQILKFPKAFWHGSLWSIQAAIYCGTRAVGFLAIILAINYSWRLAYTLQTANARLVILLTLIVISLYLYTKVIVLIFAVFTSILSGGNARNSIRLILLMPKLYRLSALVWFSVLVVGGFYLNSYLIKNELFLELLQFKPNLVLVIKSVLLWYFLTQVALNLLDGLLVLDRKINPTPQFKVAPAPAVKIDNLVIEG